MRLVSLVGARHQFIKESVVNKSRSRCGRVASYSRTKKKAAEFGLDRLLEKLIVTEPLGYMELMSLLQNARYAITDTGWHLLENDPCDMDWLKETEKLAQPIDYPGDIFGDGQAAEKIVKTIQKTFD